MAMLMREKSRKTTGSVPAVLSDVLATMNPARAQREKAWKKAAGQVIRNIQAGKEMSFQLVQLMMEQQTFFRIENGRYYVALSLAEAETLRGVMHMRQLAPLLGPESTVALALHTVSPTGRGGIIEESHGFQRSGPYQQEIAHNCFRFLDSQTGFTEQQRNYVIRALQATPCSERQDWYGLVAEGRRRAQRKWQSSPVAQILRTADIYEFLELRALRYRLRQLIKSKGLFIKEAYRAFNKLGDGALTCSELYSAAKWLGLALSVEQVHAVVASIDTDNDGFLSFLDFKAGFHEDGDEEDVLALFDGADAPQRPASLEIPQEQIPELNAGLAAESAKKIEIPEEVVRGFKVKLKPIDSSGDFRKVWNSEGTGARDLVSVWRPKEGGEESAGDDSHSQTACVGYYATLGDKPPPKDAGCAVLRIRDTKVGKTSRDSDHIQDVLARYLPHPKRFHQVWNKQTGDQELYCWKPVPPSKRFVSLGMICTTTDEPPPVEAVRCVPHAWVKPVTEEPTAVWNDAGSGGRPGALWRTNTEGMVAAAQRHTPPHEVFYTLKTHEFFINPMDDMSVADIARANKEKFEGVVASDPGFAFVKGPDFTKLWDSTKSGADGEGSVWRPRLPEGAVFFGDVAVPNHKTPDAGVDVLISHSDHEELLAPPLKLELVWFKKTSKQKIYVWQGVPPSEAFACIGHVVSTEVPAEDSAGKPVPPAIEQYRMVHRALLQPRSLRKANKIWDDSGFWSKGDDGALWGAPPPLGTFIGAGYPSKGYAVPTGMFATLAVDFTPATKFRRARATRNYTAEDRETQLSFKVGQELVVVEGAQGEPWWSGYLGSRKRTDERVGMFPANHCEIQGSGKLA